MILGFKENSEAFIDAQHPSDLLKSLNLNAADLTNIYTLHWTENKEPNFFQMEIKDISVASFFTGFSPGRYVGRPNCAITVFLDNEEIEEKGLSEDFEGMIRRLAHIVLTKRDNNPDFDDMFKEFFLMLKNEDLEPYWEEVEEKEIDEELVNGEEVVEEEEIDEELVSEEEVVEEVVNEEIMIEEEISDEFMSGELKTKIIDQLENGISGDHLDKLEKEVVEEEINDLKRQLKESNEEIGELIKSITEYQFDREEIDEIIDKNEALKEDINKLTEQSNQQNEEKKKLEDKITELMIELEEKRNEFKIELEEKETKINELNQEIEKLKKENINQLDRITGLKIELRKLTSKDEKVQDNLADAMIDMKKELKVLRRERDHYKKIVKDNDLL